LTARFERAIVRFRMNPKLKAVLFPLLAALCGYMASYFSSGCTPAQIQHVESAADRVAVQALCLKAAAEQLDDLLLHPESLKLSDLKAARKAVDECLHPAPAADAGA
jgi:hypothetical protein